MATETKRLKEAVTGGTVTEAPRLVNEIAGQERRYACRLPVPQPLPPILTALLLAALAACGGEYPPPPETAQVPFVETIHGVEFEDPYRWLNEQDSPATRDWIDRQNEYAETILGEPAERDWARRRLRELMGTPAIGSPNKAGDFEVFTLRRAGEELASIVRRKAPEDGSEAGPARIDPTGEYDMVVDPADLSADYTHILDIVSVSPDGQLLLYSIRVGGEDETTVRLRDLEQNVDLDFEMPRALNDQAFFAKDGSGIYYTIRSRTEGSRVRFHTLRHRPRGRHSRIRRRDRAAELRPRRAARRHEAARRRSTRMGLERAPSRGGRHLAGDADRHRHGGPLQHPQRRRQAVRAHQPRMRR